ncbi:hypothetical protein NEOKW01_1617 [Nematocida sp. AWRm80]|nr:hypothetical protein NEOKW01_1617 [Nematocida sp. AWRm80]
MQSSGRAAETVINDIANVPSFKKIEFISKEKCLEILNNVPSFKKIEFISKEKCLEILDKHHILDDLTPEKCLNANTDKKKTNLVHSIIRKIKSSGCLKDIIIMPTNKNHSEHSNDITEYDKTIYDLIEKVITETSHANVPTQSERRSFWNQLAVNTTLEDMKNKFVSTFILDEINDEYNYCLNAARKAYVWDKQQPYETVKILGVIWERSNLVNEISYMFSILNEKLPENYIKTMKAQSTKKIYSKFFTETKDTEKTNSVGISNIHNHINEIITKLQSVPNGIDSAQIANYECIQDAYDIWYSTSDLLYGYTGAVKAKNLQTLFQELASSDIGLVKLAGNDLKAYNDRKREEIKVQALNQEKTETKAQEEADKWVDKKDVWRYADDYDCNTPKSIATMLRRKNNYIYNLAAIEQGILGARSEPSIITKEGAATAKNLNEKFDLGLDVIEVLPQYLINQDRFLWIEAAGMALSVLSAMLAVLSFTFFIDLVYVSAPVLAVVLVAVQFFSWVGIFLASFYIQEKHRLVNLNRSFSTILQESATRIFIAILVATSILVGYMTIVPAILYSIPFSVLPWVATFFFIRLALFGHQTKGYKGIKLAFFERKAVVLTIGFIAVVILISAMATFLDMTMLQKILFRIVNNLPDIPDF